jgi:hypothetical protein
MSKVWLITGRLTRLSPTTTAESKHDVHVAVIALYRHWRSAELTRPAGMGFAADWQRHS